MSTADHPSPLRLRPEQTANLSEASMLSVHAFRTLLHVAARLRAAMDERLREDGLTTQQAALITVVEASGAPSLSEAAAALTCTRQNVKQLARALQRKGFLDMQVDPDDARVTRLVATRLSRDYWAGRDSGDVDAVATWFGDLEATELRSMLGSLDRVLARIATDGSPDSSGA